MKKTIYIIATFVLLIGATPQIGDAKPAYCDVAYLQCVQDCNNYSAVPFFTQGCVTGCTIGYWGCGSGSGQ